MARKINKKIRNSAKGQECQLQIHPYCNGNPETTVLCHMPSTDNGVGLKASDDFWASYGCSDCHDVVDGRRNTELSKAEVLKCMFRGVYRTQKLFIDQGLIKI